MNGVHDMGGMHGFGPVQRERNEPKFHAAWEARIQSLMRLVVRPGQHVPAHTGFFNLDEFRSGIERMDPVAYLAASYYERWMASLETNLVEQGILTREEIDTRHAMYAADPTRPVSSNDEPTVIVPTTARGGNDRRERGERSERGRERGRPVDLDPPPPRFASGAPVIARNTHPVGHTRLPRYARGKRGSVAAVRDREIFPDTHFDGHAGDWHWVYTVRFAARELWGDAAEPNGSVHIDLWEAYLDPA